MTSNIDGNATMIHWVLARIDRMCGVVDRGVRAAIIGFLGAIFLLLMLQVVMRYVIRTPLIWVEELSSYTLAFLVLWGGSSLVRTWGHVRVDTFYVMMPRQLRAGLAIFLNLLVAYFGYVLAKSGYRLGILGAADLSPSGAFNLFWPRQAMTTGGALIIVQALNNVLRVLSGRGGYLVADDTGSSKTHNAK